MMFGNIPTLFKIILNCFIEQFITAIKKIEVYVFFEFKHTEFFTSRGGYLLNTKL